MSRVTVVDVLDAGACIDGVLQFIAANGMRIECDSGEFDEPYIQQAKLNGYGDGYGDGYGNGYGNGNGNGDGDGNGNGDGNGDGYGYGYGYGYGDGYGYGSVRSNKRRRPN